MAQTDGYITSDPNGRWQYVNCSENFNAFETLQTITNLGVGDDVDAAGDAYARISSGWVAGTACSWNGTPQAGPVISLTTPSALLAGAPATTLDAAANPEDNLAKLSIVWAGVHPESLDEVIIVWSQNVRLLNPKGVSLGDYSYADGITNVAVMGRVMIVKLKVRQPIDNSIIQRLSIAQATVACYWTSTVTDFEYLEPNKTISTAGGTIYLNDVYTDGVELDSQLVSFTGPTPSAGTPTIGYKAMLKQAEPHNVPPLPSGPYTADIVPGAPARRLVMYANVAMQLDVKCVHPFTLEPVYICSSARQAYVWEVCYSLFGTTLPQRIYPLTYLRTIVLTGFTVSPFATVVDADALQLNVSTAYGPVINLNGCRSCSSGPIVNGQVVQLDICGASCTDPGPCYLIISDLERETVYEDIGKFKPRVLPLVRFEQVGLALTEIPNIVSTSDTTISTFQTGINVATSVEPKIGYLHKATAVNAKVSTTEVVTSVLSTTVNVITSLDTTVAYMQSTTIDKVKYGVDTVITEVGLSPSLDAFTHVTQVFGHLSKTTISVRDNPPTTSLMLTSSSLFTALTVCNEDGTPTSIQICTHVEIWGTFPRFSNIDVFNKLKPGTGDDQVVTAVDTNYTQIKAVTYVGTNVNFTAVTYIAEDDITVFTDITDDVTAWPVVTDVTSLDTSIESVTHVGTSPITIITFIEEVEVFKAQLDGDDEGSGSVVTDVEVLYGTPDEITISTVQIDGTIQAYGEGADLYVLQQNPAGDLALIGSDDVIETAYKTVYVTDACGSIVSSSVTSIAVDTATSIALAVGVYTIKDGPGTSFNCPCYYGPDATTQITDEQQGDYPEVCSMRVARLQRPWCITCV